MSLARRRLRHSLLICLLPGVLMLGLRCGQTLLPMSLPGLEASVRVYTDAQGTPHVIAETRGDLYRVWGYVQARDRFFQMDFLRRTVAGRQAELVGALGLDSDGFFRPLGLERVALRGRALASPEVNARFDAFADGVNAWLAANPLPPEYADLELTSVPAWRAEDSAMLGLTPGDALRFFELQRSGVVPVYEAALGAEVGRALIDEILDEAPMVAVPAAPGEPPVELAAHPLPGVRRGAPEQVLPGLLGSRAAVESRLSTTQRGRGASNAWVVSGDHTETGRPIVAADPHVFGGVPNLYHEIHLSVLGGEDALTIAGTGYVGWPAMVHWHNGDVALSTTFAPTDLADYFADRLVRSHPDCPTRLCIVSEGEYHEVIEHPEIYHANFPTSGVQDDLRDLTFIVAFSAPAAAHVLEVPFRSFGPVYQIADASVLGSGPQAETQVVTLQSASFEPQQSGEALLAMETAHDVFEIEQAVGQLAGLTGNFLAADREGNIAYLTSGEVPLRADLEQGYVHGEPPWRIRDGSGPANWLKDPERSQGQAIPYRIVPRNEMPRSVNPRSGLLVNSNQDAQGLTWDGDPLNERRPSSATGLYYIGSDYWPGLRAARIAELLQDRVSGGGRFSIADMVAMQGNTQGMDAQLLRPFLLHAFERGLEPGALPELVQFAADPEVREAVERIGRWDLSRPTGIAEGWDYGKPPPPDAEISEAEAEASVAATLFAMWRGTVNQATTLRVIFDELALPYPGVAGDFGIIHTYDLFRRPAERPSGLDFFDGPPGLSPEDERDVVILRSMREALDTLASAPVFSRSTRFDDYRWGRLHRLSIPHPFSRVLSVPPAAGFSGIGPGAPGIPRDGGFGTVNFGHDSDGGADPLGFRLLFSISTNRMVMSFDEEGRPIVLNQMAGPASGNPNDPNYQAALRRWLSGTPHRLEMRRGRLQEEAVRAEIFSSE